jgi:hypothetical protein
LALILGDGKQLVTQVVPQALLEFSRGCMRSIFSSLIQKPVYTFQVRKTTKALLSAQPRNCEGCTR